MVRCCRVFVFFVFFFLPGAPVLPRIIKTSNQPPAKVYHFGVTSFPPQFAPLLAPQHLLSVATTHYKMENKKTLLLTLVLFLLVEAANALKLPSLRRLLATHRLLARPLAIHQLKTKRPRPPLIVEPPLDTARSLKSAQKPKVLFVLGGPGAGKGTQCAKLSNEFGMVHISAGDLLREEMTSGSPLGALISGYVSEGTIVPVKVTIELLRAKIFAMESTANRFLIDGFPRNEENLQGKPTSHCTPPSHPLTPSLSLLFTWKGWNECMTDLVDLEGVIFIDCPQEEMEKRLLSRGLTSGRTDDNLETARSLTHPLTHPP